MATIKFLHVLFVFIWVGNLMALTQQHFSDVEVIKKGLLPKMNAVDAGYIYGAAGNISAAKELNKLKNAIIPLIQIEKNKQHIEHIFETLQRWNQEALKP